MYSDERIQELANQFRLVFVDDAWKKGKSIQRRQAITQSILFDDRHFSRVKSHIKTEVCAMKPKKARLIQAFDAPVDNYIVADHYRAFTEALLHVTLEPTVYQGMYVHLRSACGLNRLDMSRQIYEWLLEAPLGGKNHIFIDDVSNMDGNVQLVHLDAQQRLYEALSPDLAAHHRATISFKGCIPRRAMTNADSTVFYRAVGTVKSGAQDTSSGQTCRRIDGVVRNFHTLGCKAIRGFAFGDDVWLIVTFDVLPTCEQVMAVQATYGWPTRGVFTQELEESEFLSCSFAYCVGGVHMFPKLGRMFAKLFWTWRRLSARKRRHYVTQIALSTLPAYEGFALVQAWLRWHIDSPPRTVPEWMLRPSLCAPVGEVRWTNFIIARYGALPPTDLIARIKRLSKDDVHLLADPWVRTVMIRDLVDPAESVGVDTISLLLSHSVNE